ncbi:hypothetical protein U1R68_12835 [Pectobacterium colocasium]|nr:MULTISPECIES: hypothetical protein [Pectobacterium]
MITESTIHPNPASDRTLAVLLPHHLSSSPADYRPFPRFIPGL